MRLATLKKKKKKKINAAISAPCRALCRLVQDYLSGVVSLGLCQWLGSAQFAWPFRNGPGITSAVCVFNRLVLTIMRDHMMTSPFHPLPRFLFREVENVMSCWFIECPSPPPYTHRHRKCPPCFKNNRWINELCKTNTWVIEKLLITQRCQLPTPLPTPTTHMMQGT